MSALVLAPVITVGAPAQAQPDPGCLSEGGATVEEARATQAVPQELLDRSGLAPDTESFRQALCAASDLEEASAIVQSHGDALWRTVVDRVRGTGYAEGELSTGDDRPLYWARLTMTSALNRWQPGFELAATDRAALVADLERRSRGHHDADFSAAPAESERASEFSRVLVTGFDPFGLDHDIRQANPSGAAALALDGAVIETADGIAVVESIKSS